MKAKMQTLRNQLLLFILVLVILLSVSIAWGIYSLSNSLIMEQIGNSRSDVLKQIGERISGVKNSMVYALNTVSTDKQIMEYIMDQDGGVGEEEFAAVMAGLVQQLDNAFQSSDFQYEAACYLRNGISWSTRNGDAKSLGDIRNELWFKDLLKDTGQVLWISSSIAQMKDSVSEVAVVKAINGGDGEIAGIILISVNETLFGDTYENVLNQDNEIYIVDDTGKIVSSNQKERLGLRYFNMKNLYELTAGNRYTLVMNQQGGKLEERLISVVLDEASTWTMVEFVKTDEIFSEMNKVTVKIELFVIATIAIAGIWGWHFSNKMVKPLKQLEQDMEKVKNGDIYVETGNKGWREAYEIRANFNDMMIKIQELMENIRKNEQEKHKLELEFLQAQINPHFLYNTLFSIKCLVEMDEKRNAAVMLSDFIDLLRMILKKEGEFITLERELECVEKYTEIQKYRYEDWFDVYFDIPRNCLKLLLPKLILQPIIENAIFHGIEPKNSSGTIVINAKRENDKLLIYVSDDGVGMNEQKKGEVMNGGEKEETVLNNIGIQNVNSRIQLLYGAAFGLSIESEPDYGTTVAIELPCCEGELENEDISGG